MPAPVLVQSQLQALETGLKDIKRSQLLRQPEVKTMYTAIENHHRDFKLAHLTGKAKDLLLQAEQDTKFYYILVRMLGEILHSSNGQQRIHTKSVYRWYQNNKHVLYSGPRFGRKNTVTKRSMSHDSLEGSFEKLLREIQKAQNGLKPEQFDPESMENKENLLTELVDEEDKMPTEEDFPHKRPHTVATPERRQPVQSKPINPDSYEHLLPKRKTVPLSHLFNPHSRDMTSIPQEDNEETTITEIASPVKLKLGVGAATGQQNESKLGHRKKWDAFQQEFNFGQDILGKLQYVGRNGIPGGVRYTAHDQGLMAEAYTRDVINGYLQCENHKLSLDGTQKESTSRPRSRLTEPKLEQFYEMAEAYYPAKLPRYPSFDKTRAKSAPLNGRPKSAKTRVSSAKLGGRLLETPEFNRTESEKSEITSIRSTEEQVDVKLDTVVSMIDSVTDEMSYYKEKLAPEPHHGFRQPTVIIDPAQRPHTAPAGSVARPVSPEDFYHNSESAVQRELQAAHGYLLDPPQQSQYTVHFRQDPSPKSSSVVEAIDWRGKVTPDTVRYSHNRPNSVRVTQPSSPGWSATALGNHTYMKKFAHPTSLRTMGTTHGGGRPQTAPTTTQERWGIHQPEEEDVKVSQAASHRVRELDPNTVHDLIQIQHLVSSTKRKRSRYMRLSYEYLLNKDSRPATSTTQDGPSMEFMSIAAPKSIGGSRPTSPSKSVHDDDMTDVSTCRESHATLTIPSATGDDEGVPEIHDHDSISRVEFDGPNMADFDEEQDGGGHSNSSVTNEAPSQEYVSQQTEPPANNQELLDDIKKLLGRESLHDDHEVIQYPPVQSPTEHVNIQYPENTTEHDDDNDDGDDDTLGTFVTASQRSPAPNSEKTDSHLTTGSHPGQQQPLSKSTYWSYVPELDLADKDIDQHLLDVEKDLIHVTPRHHPKTKLGRAFPRAPSAPAHSHLDQSQLSLSIEGVSTDMRARSAGTVPARAKNTDRHMVLLKQHEMLRKSPVKAYRTPPSIPSPFNPYGTRSPRRGTTYSSELEMHAVKDTSPRHYLQKVGHLRSEEYEPDELNENNMAGELRPLTSSMRVVRMRTKNLRETPSPMEYMLQGHPGTPVESLPDDMDGMRHYYNESCESGVERDPNVSPAAQRSSDEESRQRYLDMGRPISDYLEHADPDDYYAAVEKQKQAKAAVNIQRIFRGYVARNQYKYLQREDREHREEKRQAAVDIQSAYRGHLARKNAVARRAPSAETLAWAKEHKMGLIEKQAMRERKAELMAVENAKKNAKTRAKIAIIGPHVEVYVPFHPKQTAPEKWVLDAAATAIQRHIRGWLIRVRLNKLKRKAKMHGGTWERFIQGYRQLLFQTQRRLGIEKPKFFFSFEIINDFMDTKRRYEQVFDKKAFSNELEIDELIQFFQECNLFPAQTEVQDVLRAMFRGQPTRKSSSLRKQEVLEMAFQIYPPKGTGIVSNRQSTWMTPIIEGEEALKLMGTEGVEPTDFKTCWNLVSSSHRDRAEVEQHKREVQREEEWARAHGQQPQDNIAQDSDLKLTVTKQLGDVIEEDETSVQESQASSQQAKADANQSAKQKQDNGSK